jgi:hypothetical protein
MSLKDLFKDIYETPFDYFKVGTYYPDTNDVITNRVKDMEFDDLDLDGGSFVLYKNGVVYGIYDEYDIDSFILYNDNKVEKVFYISEYKNDCLRLSENA